jgi:putative membrane protein
MIALHGTGGSLHGVFEQWVFAPGIAIPLVASGALYARGTALLWRQAGVGHGVRRWQAGSFACGWLVTATALASPLHTLSEQLFWVHMVQHELLMAVAAPLLVLGRPLVPMLWALPPRARVAVGSLARHRWWSSAWRVVSSPLSAWVLQALALWLWHLPVAFQATLDDERIHALQHVTFVATSLLFWWSLVHGSRRHASYGAGIVYLFTTFVHTGALGALLTFSRVPWYPRYAATSLAFGLTPLEDQQLAGLIMWLPASTSYLVAALVLLVLWMRSSEARVALRERSI